ncbi:DNA polymerase III subunit delta [Methylocella silvestris]|uniref:DNA polymerase III subunit delta n=1 Tax=Methylocella silvestris TaxID=199596 RepID=A0A2J7TJF0_METSI|nr:DNA polymerase III subunit delta [Methylocella silvestris]PNG26886.1 DNA polymerase III subunit delta [Methylocella silvestris]
MVAIKSFEADKFLDRPAPHIFVYLLYGPDAGLVAERARALVKKSVADPKDPFQLLRIGGDDLAADPLRLADEANTIGLFGDRRAIWIEAQGRAFVTALEPLFAAPPQGSTIIIEAGALKKDSALRRLCEREKSAAAIACEPDRPEEIAHLIEREAAAAGLSVTPEAKTLLVSLLGQDRLATRGELEKLVLYAHGASAIGLQHVEAIVSDASSLLLDHAVDGAFGGDFDAVEAGARRLAAQGADVNQLLGAALRYSLGLRRARLEIDAGGGQGHGYGFGRSRAFDQHVRLWSAERLARAIDILAEAVRRTRREPKLAQPIALRALWSVASAAKARGARA